MLHVTAEFSAFEYKGRGIVVHQTPDIAMARTGKVKRYVNSDATIQKPSGTPRPAGPF
mgnify:CR=1 FL=1